MTLLGLMSTFNYKATPTAPANMLWKSFQHLHQLYRVSDVSQKENNQVVVFAL